MDSTACVQRRESIDDGRYKVRSAANRRSHKSSRVSRLEKLTVPQNVAVKYKHWILKLRKLRRIAIIVLLVVIRLKACIVWHLVVICVDMDVQLSRADRSWVNLRRLMETAYIASINTIPSVSGLDILVEISKMTTLLIQLSVQVDYRYALKCHKY